MQVWDEIQMGVTLAQKHTHLYLRFTTSLFWNDY